MIETKVLEKLARLDDATILRRLPDNERSFFEYGFQRGYNRAINEFLKDLWHDVDEMPERAKAFIFECGDYSMNYYVGKMFNPNDYKKNAEIWLMNRWCYLEDILPKQEGGEQ